ncbi:MAG: sodium:proton antiporter [Candidatus Binatia bacterium]
MQIPILLVVAVFMSCGLYLLLDRTLLRVVLGLGLLSNGINLMLLAAGGLESGSAPIMTEGAAVTVDPLPQALILTAIVIGFGVTALLLSLAYKTYLFHHTDDLGDLHGVVDGE